MCCSDSCSSNILNTSLLTTIQSSDNVSREVSDVSELLFWIFIYLVELP